MIELLPFFIVLFAGLFFSEVFNRLHLPWVVALILAGIIVGPHGLGVYEPNATIEFLGEIGLVFLMFMAGLEVRFSDFKKGFRGVERLALINGLIPAAVGVGLAHLLGLDLIPALLIGIVFISSSIAVVIPSLEANGLLHERLGKSIIAATMFEDIASLVLLSVLFQSIDPQSIPLPLFYILLIGVLVVLRWALPKLRWFFSYETKHERDIFQQELRAIFVILIGTVVTFELIGLHPIIAGFFAGAVLSDSITSSILRDKLHTFSYGIFIPFFFILVGSQADIGILFEGSTGLIALILIAAAFFSKFISGWLGGRLNGFSHKQSALIGASTTPQLSTTLAVAFAGLAQGILTQEIVTSLIALSIVTTFIAPLLISSIAKKHILPVGVFSRPRNPQKERQEVV